MRTVTLEILRHGPPNNQLLSPLTQYLALCGDMPAATVTVPFEHAEFLLRFRNLQYMESEQARELELQETARKMSGVLADVPGLIRELKAADGESPEIVHLRLVSNANELALLPFELANAPVGCPGAGQPILLQTQTPISLTREARRVSSPEITPIPKAERPPKVLFAAASPEGVGEVPLRAHLLALRKAIDPWVFAHFSDAERRDQVSKLLTVLPRASLKQIADACASGEYTHVHLLAHGQEIEKSAGKRFGLALHNETNSDQMDLVEGDRLTKALRNKRRMGDGTFTRPSAVTLAACNAGDVGSVVGAGASIAHALHEDGIPLVVASQFPLSFAGSIVLTEVVYEGLLWGEDPRTFLVQLRRELKTRVPETHDWASIVAYVSFPPDLETQLSKYRLKQGHRALEAVLNDADRRIRTMSRRYRSVGERRKTERDPVQELAKPRERLREVRARLEEYLKVAPADHSIYGLIASAEKRLAEVMWRTKKKALWDDAKTSLSRARDYYRQSFGIDKSYAWGLVQDMAITGVLDGPAKISLDDWQMAEIISRRELKVTDQQRVLWAHGNLIELCLLAIAMGNRAGLPSKAECEKRAQAYAKGLLEVADPSSWEIYTTRRQILRYCEFFNVANAGMQVAASLAANIWGQLPEPQEER